MTHPWDSVPSSDGYAKWTEPGDNVKGTVVDVGIGQDLNGNDAPQIIVETEAGTVTITASQAQLRAKLLDARPNVGDTIAVMFTGEEKRPGGKTLKEFDVAVKAGNGKAAPAAATAGKPSASDLI